MKRTISIMVGHGSLDHNRREFNAKNIDPQRSHLNVEFYNEDLRSVYHQLFDEAQERYNQKQTRSDRCIQDYYEKIRTGKQEKLFHEIVVQIGNKDNTGVLSECSVYAQQALKDYMQSFQQRNPSLRVFSAHLHMDEATPHLHIDFVPFITGSKRGMDTRVSLKQALASLGFKGGTREDTEWSQWVNSEKEKLAEIMQNHLMDWEQLGTHNEHLSVLDFKKQERTREIEALTEIELQKTQAIKKAVSTLQTVQKQQVNIDQLEKIEGKKSLLNGRVSLDPEEFQQLKTGAQKYVAYRRKDNKLQALLDAANEKIAQLTASNTYWEQQAQEKDRTISHLQNALAARESVKERLDRNALQQENRSLKQELLQLKELLHRHGIAAEHTVPKQYIECQ